MKSRITAALVALAVLALAFAAVASAADHNTKGKLASFSYDKSTKVGHLTVQAKETREFRVTKDTVCGEHRGDSGDGIPCKTLGKPKYHNKVVHVTWHRGKSGARVPSLVSVDM
jgi:Ni/Co efflux regulator RcnB